MTGFIIAETKHWEDVVVGDLVHIEAHRGLVVAVDVDPLFCAHTFEDGRTISQPRNRLVETKWPATQAEVDAHVTTADGVVK